MRRVGSTTGSAACRGRHPTNKEIRRQRGRKRRCYGLCDLETSFLLICLSSLVLIADTFSTFVRTRGDNSVLCDVSDTLTSLSLVKKPSETLIGNAWYPRRILQEDDILSGEKAAAIVEQKAIPLAADLIWQRLNHIEDNVLSQAQGKIPKQVKGRFMDLTCTAEGEMILEQLFLDSDVLRSHDVFLDDEQNTEQGDIILGAVMAIQSICVMGTCVGLKGPPEQLKRMLAHLDSRNDPSLLLRDLDTWDRDSVRRLKYRQDRTPAVNLLAQLKWKRTPQGAFDLLVALGAWEKHEDLALLRSGFPIRFTEAEITSSKASSSSSNTADGFQDPDKILGIRRDLRELKVYTVDSESTSEVDDGISLEKITKENGEQGHRIWIHIADAERWTNNEVFDIARRRITSLYLPCGSYPMIPADLSSDVMSLIMNRDTCALSMGIELNDDGSIDANSMIVTPSHVCVDYRLTYDDVDEMLEEGTGYNEEWQLGALLDAAVKRRTYRVNNGSSEGLVPTPIPAGTVSVRKKADGLDGIEIEHNIQVSHNAGVNQTIGAQDGSSESDRDTIYAAPVSSAYLLVTEMMILAGEAIGQWKIVSEKKRVLANGDYQGRPNQLRLPFRTQPPPDFKSRAREKRVMEDLLEFNVGNGLCQAWYARRFLQPVKVQEEVGGHSGLGLSTYVQWTSPIRRFTDLQVHIAVKRYLRRERLMDLLAFGEVDSLIKLDARKDFGFPEGVTMEQIISKGTNFIENEDLDQDLNFFEGLGLMGAARTLQRQSQQYWMFEYVKRLRDEDPDVTFSAVVLGCVDPSRRQYAIYVEQLGLEHRMTSPGNLSAGTKLQLRVDTVQPRGRILTFVQVV